MYVATSVNEQSVLRKVAWRLIPFIGLLYLLAFLDRVNIGFAALTMNGDLGFSAQVFGAGAGIFFLGYVLFEIPSNLLLHKFGARRWIARIMITWGLLSAAMALIETAWQFYLLRFLLGVAEAGFFPGMILYLTYWFPGKHRGRILGAFLVFLPLASVIGAPVSTLLLDINTGGLKGWQWLFILEGIPAALLGIAVLKVLTDKPEHATWLTVEERGCLASLLAEENDTSNQRHSSFMEALRVPKVWFLSVMYFALLVMLYGFTLWLPQLIQQLSAFTHRQVGLLTMLPYLAAAVAMYFWGRHSDAMQERRWHLALPALVSALGLMISALSGGKVALAITGMTIGAVGVYAALPVFWTLPTAMLSGVAAAGGIALVNSVGNIGGYVGSALIGYIKDSTGDYRLALYVLAASVALGGVGALLIRRSPGH